MQRAPGAVDRRGARGSNLALVNLDRENDTFHLVEITRKTGDRKGFWGE